MSIQPESAPPDISILIVNWNTRELVLQCLDALPTGIDDGLRYEVIVVDNGSVDGSAGALAERDDIDLIRNDANLGFAAAVNQAYRSSTSKLVLLLNSDVDLTPGSLSVLARFLRERPEVAGVGPLYVDHDGVPQPFNYRLPTFKTTLVNGSAIFGRLLPGSRRLLRDYRMLDDDFSVPRPVPQPAASCLLLRRSCLPENYVLDERFPIFFNDVQLARSLAREGFELWVTPHAVVVHEAHASARMLGPGPGRRQYLASTIRMLSETESPVEVWFYRSVVLTQNLALRIAGRPALGFSDLVKALGGDPGPLPAQPAKHVVT
jgi:GT2 family glycosyltransferase